MPRGSNLVAINVGNTRTQLGLFVGGELKQSQRFGNDDLEPIIQTVTCWWPTVVEGSAGTALVASVNEPVAANLASAIKDQLSIEVYRVGDNVPVPIGQQLDPETITGIDRLLNAAAAFDTLKQACVVIDAGSAITVDFIDGEGTFHGGAIAPGAAMQLRSLHEHTAALPDIAFRAPEHEPFGRNTTQAMLQGVYQGIRGMVQRLIEQYSEHYGAFPTVIATGGDALTLFEDYELVERIVPDLTLLGIGLAARVALGDDDDEATGEPAGRSDERS